MNDLITQRWQKYNDNANQYFKENSNLDQFKVFCESIYKPEEMCKVLPQMTSLIEIIDFDIYGTEIKNTLNYMDEIFIPKVEKNNMKIIEIVKSMDKKDKNHIIDIESAKDPIKFLMTENIVLKNSCINLKKFFNEEICKVQPSVKNKNISDFLILFNCIDKNLAVLTYDTFIDWIVCNKRYLYKNIEELEERQMNFCVATEFYNLYETCINIFKEFQKYLNENFPDF
jgi:hypothetical protein